VKRAGIRLAKTHQDGPGKQALLCLELLASEALDLAETLRVLAAGSSAGVRFGWSKPLPKPALRVLRSLLSPTLPAAVLLALLGCEREPAPSPAPVAREVATPEAAPAQPASRRPVPAGPLRDTPIHLEFAVYVPEEQTDLAALAEQLLGKQLTEVPVIREPDKETPVPWVSVRLPPLSKYQAPDADRLRHGGKGLAPEEKGRVAASRQVVLLMARAPAERIDAVHRGLLAAVAALAEQVDGFPWDEATRQVYGRARWREDRCSWQAGVPDMSRHITMHAYRDGELLRIVTLGMSKFGYPDLVANQVAGRSSESMGNLINLAAQTLVERSGVDTASTLEVALDQIAHQGVKAAQNTNIGPNAARKAALPIAFVEPEEGDEHNRLIELLFDARPGESPQAVQARTLDLVYGSHDEMSSVASDDAEVKAASERALAELRALKPTFVKGVPVGDHLLVKAPFRTASAGIEWMWVEVVRWQEGTIAGILANDPFDVPELKEGARVEVKESAVFDYIHHRADGSQAGNLTGAVIERIGRDRRTK
jgi:uncharacterized protein YegJ (DUF2314 family)